MNTPRLFQRGFAMTALLGALLTGASARAGLQIPYTNDTATLHLWHLDEPSSSTTAADATTANPIPLTLLGSPVGGPFTNTTLGASSFTGQGTCNSSTTKVHLLYGGAFSDVSEFRNPTSGAFTFEAIIKLNTNFSSIDAEILCGDNGGAITARGWQWRLFNGVMEWDLLGGATDNDFKSTLPTTGPDAAIVGSWYHVAVTYTGDSPTNGDTASQITFYWTLLDANRVVADQLGQFTATRPLDGAPLGAVTPSLGIGGSARNTTTNPGNNEGLIGGLDEVRISNIARRPNQMAFVTGGAINPPKFTEEPPANTLSGYGQTLTVPALVSGTPPLAYQWLQNGTAVPGQNDTTLLISNATFANAGDYQLVVTNAYGSVSSTVATVTIGAVPTGLYNTGLDTNGVISDGDIADPHWTLLTSADPANLGPTTFVFENSNPLQFASPNGAFSPSNGISMWMGEGGNLGGNPPTSPAGLYVYRSKFLLDSADPATVTVGGNLWVSGTINDILVNGKSTGNALNPGGTLYVTTYSVTNGFVPGWNTLDFIENLTAAGVSGLRVEVHSVGQTLPPGLPTITSQPISQTVRNGSVPPNDSEATFSVVAIGRPPLSYQWSADGAPITGATNRTLTFNNPTTGAQGTDFSVVVANDSGSVTSSVAALTLVSTNQPPNATTFSFVVFQGQTATLQLSQLVQDSTDPDGDAVSFVSADGASTNGVAAGVGNVVQNNTTLVYTPVTNYFGADLFTYTVTDQMANSVGNVDILVLSQPVPQVAAPGGSATFSVGLSHAPAGYSFQWQYDGTNLAGATSYQLTINNAQIANAGTYQMAVTDPLGTVWTSAPVGLTVGAFDTGTGLTGDYYSSITNGTTNFTGEPTLTRIDPTIDFDWSTTSPDPTVSQTYFLVRWHGQVEPLYSDTYTFSATSDDGSRLWVNNQLLANQWQNQAAATAGGQIALTAGRKYDIVMEYYQFTSTAVAQLSWSSVHQAPEIIPATQLFPDTGLPHPTLGTQLTGSKLTLNWAGTYSVQSAPTLSGLWTTVANSIVGPYAVTISGGQNYYRLVEPISP